MKNDIKTSEKCNFCDQNATMSHMDEPQCTKNYEPSSNDISIQNTNVSKDKSISYTTLLAVLCLSISLCQIVCEALGFDSVVSIIVDVSVTAISMLICVGIVKYDRQVPDGSSIQQEVKKDIESNLKRNSKENTTSSKK